MRRASLAVLRCPACRGAFDLEPSAGAEVDAGELKCVACRRTWPIRNSIPRLMFPEELAKEDARVERFWNRIAPAYDLLSRVTAVQRGVPEDAERRQLARRLGVQAGSTVLEVAVGTGSNLKAIAEGTGNSVTTYGLDISWRILERARRKLGRLSPASELVVGNAHYLPFADDVFDVVLGGYGTKYFTDKAQALREMLRVTRPGGRIVVADLGLPPGKRLTLRQRLLRLWIPGISEGPPMDAVPAEALDVKLDWDAHETAYVIEFRKTAG